MKNKKKNNKIKFNKKDLKKIKIKVKIFFKIIYNKTKQ